MKQETQGILKDAGLHLDWKSRDEAAKLPLSPIWWWCASTALANCLRRRCMTSWAKSAPWHRLTKPTAACSRSAKSSCDRVGAFVRSGLHGDDFKKADQLIGKALGRVVAHELVHMLTGAKDHSHEGVFEPGLTVQQLVAGELPLSPADIERLRTRP